MSAPLRIGGKRDSGPPLRINGHTPRRNMIILVIMAVVFLGIIVIDALM